MTATKRTLFRCLAHTALSTLCLAGAMVLPHSASAQFSGGGISPWACPAPSIEQCDTAAYRATACGQARCPALETFRARVIDARPSAVVSAVPDRAPVWDRWAPTGADPTSLRRTALDTAEPQRRTTTDYTSYASLRDYLAFANAGSERRDRFPFNFSSWQSNGARVSSCIEVAHESFYDVSEWDTATLGYGDDYRRMYELAYGPTSDPRAMASRHLATGVLRGRDGAAFTAAFVNMPKNMFYVMEMLGLLAEMDRRIGDEYEAEDRAAIAALRVARPSRRADFAFHERASSALASMSRITPAYIENETATSRSRLPGLSRGRASVRTTTGYSDEELHYLRGVQRHLLDLLAELATLPMPVCELRDGVPSVVPNLPTDDLVNPAYQILDTLLGRAGQGARGAAGLDLATSLAGIDTGLAAQATLAHLAATPGASYAGAACIRAQARVMDTRDAIYREILTTIREGNRWGCFSGSEYTPCDWSPGLFVDLSRALIVDRQEQVYTQCLDTTSAAEEIFAGFSSPWYSFNYWFQRPYAAEVVGFEGASCHTFDAYDYTSTASRFRFVFPIILRDAQARHVQCVYEGAQEALRAGYPMLVDPETGELHPPGFSFERRGGEGNDWLGLNWSWGATMDVTGFNEDPQDASERTCALAPSASAHFDATASVLTRSIPLIHGDVSSSYRDADERGVLTVMDSVAPSVGSFTIARSSEVRAEMGASFPILGISLRLTAGVAGRAGAELSVHHEAPAVCGSSAWSSRVRAELIPSVGVDGLASAALDAYVARIGVRGRLELLTTAIPVAVGVTASGADSNTGSMSLDYGASIDVSFFSGRLSAFAEVGVCPFCDSAERTIVGWEGLSYSEPLVGETYTLPLNTLRSAL